VLQYVAVCCSMLQWSRALPSRGHGSCRVLQCVAPSNEGVSAVVTDSAQEMCVCCCHGDCVSAVACVYAVVIVNLCMLLSHMHSEYRCMYSYVSVFESVFLCICVCMNVSLYL